MGLSLLPFDDHTYVQAPHEPISESTYKRMLQSLVEIDLTKIDEKHDLTSLAEELACFGGGSCELKWKVEMKLHELEKMTQLLWILMDLELMPQVGESSMIWMIYIQEMSRNQGWDTPDMEDIWIGMMNRHEK